MKKIMCWSLAYQLTAIIIATAYVFAGDITLQWDANIPAPDGYRVFARVQTDSFDYTNPNWTGTDITCTLTIPDNVPYAFVVRAFDDESESSDSNEVYYTYEPQPDAVIIPGRPKVLTIIFE